VERWAPSTQWRVVDFAHNRENLVAWAGAFCYPMRLAAPVALKAILDFLLKEQHELGEVRMVLYTREQDKAYAVYAQALEQLLGAEATA